MIEFRGEVICIEKFVLFCILFLRDTPFRNLDAQALGEKFDSLHESEFLMLD